MYQKPLRPEAESLFRSNNEPAKSPLLIKRFKSRSECSATEKKSVPLRTHSECDYDSVQSVSDDEVELRYFSNNEKGKKSRHSLKSLSNSFRNSFRVKRSKSCNDREDAPKIKPKRSTTIRLITSILFSTPIGLLQSVPPAPLLIEDPPSNDDGSTDLEENIKYLGDPALLNGADNDNIGRRLSLPVSKVFGFPKKARTNRSNSEAWSSGNFRSAGAKSAPSTPHGGGSGSSSIGSSVLGVAAGHSGGLVINALGTTTTTTTNSDLFGTTVSQPCTPNCTSPSIQRSPSHSVFTKCDKTNLKNLSTSTPQMTAQGQLNEPPSPKTIKEAKVRPTSKSHQKKFNRHFHTVDDEVVLNHYLCALIGDILLQGHLYITHNYFAFYSNVFGYVTKLLIPILSVKEITKEKTAKIIPNAVGIKTIEDKHVFGSLMSRDATLDFMTKVWNKAKQADANSIVAETPDDQEIEGDSSESGESGRDSPLEEEQPTFKKCDNLPVQSQSETEKPISVACERRSSQGITRTLQNAISEFSKLPRQSLILFATTLLLILLFLSAGVLLYRISKIQNRYSLALQDSRSAGGGDDIYNNILHWQSHLHTRSAGAVNNFLDSNLDQIAKVRQSLEALSTLLLSKSNPIPKKEDKGHNEQKTDRNS
ncbi:uncharacterized protein LOC109605487 isoform X3 [Aethina tumida]|uniref:uncharacterized protein LOC109605487 isoform X3 n=1 Tax=Aethina tumida TaxID=116153 RepID=UPI0021475B79|nr:uncharacterized protein LOC109605487 isoform X3 [Aethina tumida]